MEDGSLSLFNFLTIVALLAMNAFFVISEFAIIKVRRTRIEQLIQEKSRLAKQAKKVIDDMDTHLAAAQFGITLASLGIGWLGEPVVAGALENYALGTLISSKSLLHTISFVVGFMLVTFIHIIFGEQVPKMLGIDKAEKFALWTAAPLHLFCKISYPAIKLIKGSTSFTLKIAGVKTSGENEAHSEEEIKMIVSSSSELDPDEQVMIKNVFEFNDRIVREIMVHRTDMICVYLSDAIDESLKVIKENKHARYPVCNEDKDDIIGYILVKDLFDQDPAQLDLESAVRGMPKILEFTPAKKALRQMQKEKSQMAIVTDEYGGVSGLVTIEDILEQLVGEIQDEFDDEETPFQTTENGVLVDGGVLVSDVDEQFGIDIEELDGIDTIGGYVLSKLEAQAAIGSLIQIANYEVKVEELEGQRIGKLQFRKLQLEAEI